MDYGEFLLPKGIVGYESESGYYDYWYPSKTRPVEIKNEVLAKHLNLWKNQGEFLAISVPYEAFRGDCSAGKSKKHICIWFRKSAIDKLVNYKI